MLYAEDDYDLYLAPRVAEYSPIKGGTSRHLMVNGTPERMAIKVKCSNNECYRVSPVYTCLDPGCSQRLQVIRDPGKPKVDKLIILYKKTTCKSAIEAFVSTNEENNEIKKALIALVSIKHHGVHQPTSKNGSQLSNETADDKADKPPPPLPNGEAKQAIKIKDKKKDSKKSKK